jgi:hypothetical protein
MDESDLPTLPPDTLNSQSSVLDLAVGVLKRRGIEARLLAPLIAALGEEFGREQVVEVVRHTIIEIARGQGAALAEGGGGDTLALLLTASSRRIRLCPGWGTRRRGTGMRMR